MSLSSPPLILDNTIVGHFGITGNFYIILKLYKNNLVIPTNVIAEAIKVPSLDTCLGAALRSKEIEEYTIDFTNGEKEFREYLQLRKKFGDGESAVMAIAKTWSGTVGSDDLRATRKYCDQHGIPLLGTLGVLYDAYDNKLINEVDADKALNDMISQTNYKTPVHNFVEVIDWFRDGKGKKLY